MSAVKPLVASFNREGTGLEYLQRIIAGEYAPLPIGETLGFRIAAAERGKVTIRGRPDEKSLNLLNTVHGGWSAAVLDTAMALSNLTLLTADQSFTTLDIRINYIRPITLQTGDVVAEGGVINGGRRVAYCEAKLMDSAGKLLAHGTGTCLILPREVA
jgi:uncharacterized protein (TIGR00369 family)